MYNDLSFNINKLKDLYNEALTNLNKCKEAFETVKSEMIKIGDNWTSNETKTYESFKEKFEEKEGKLNEMILLMQEFVNNLSMKINDYESATQKINNSFE